jgi:copper chaperone for superoxide dismutase
LQQSIATELLGKLQKLDSTLIQEVGSESMLFVSPFQLKSITAELQSHQIPYRVLGSPNALVCMFEFFRGELGWPEKTSKGLCRVTPIEDQLFIDGAVSQLEPGVYTAAIHEFGDLSKGIHSAGGVYRKLKDVIVDQDGKASWNETVQGELWEWVGKSMCLQKGSESICGILARSAGVFENKKRVCACSGKTIWEE